MMKTIFSLLVLVAIVQSSYAQQRKTLLVIVDGIPADLIKKLNTPNIDAISGKKGFQPVFVGGEKDEYSQTPTISAVGYNTVLTGTWVNKHNVWDNDIADPNYHYKTIFHFLKQHDSTRKIGIFSSWLDNRTKLVNMHFDYKFDGLELDTINYPHDDGRDFMNRIDEAVVDSASSCIRLHAPDLSWVYLEYTDDMGHMYGDGPQYYKAIEIMDRQLGELWQAIKHRQNQYKEDWLVIITTDHGRDSATGKHHGGQSDRERSGWIATNAKDLNQHFKSGKPSIADIMPTIARFMQIEIPRKDAMEIDGISLTGRVDISHPTARLDNGRIIVTWNNLNKNGDVRLWLATTNNFKTGAEDEYKLVLSVPVKRRRAEIKVSNLKSNFYKVVFETPNQYLNRWVIQKKNP